MQAIEELYTRTLESYSRQAKDGEFGSWENVLGSYAYRDLDAALRRWQADTEVEEYTNRPRGSRMPSVTELKASIERTERAAGTRFESCGKCEEGWVRVFTGMTIGSKDCKPSQVDPKVGAVKRCQCFLNWAADKKMRQ